MRRPLDSATDDHALLHDERHWPPDEADEIFLFRALMALNAYRIEAGRPVAIIDDVRFALQRGELQAVSINQQGTTRPVERDRWKSDSGYQLFLTGRMKVHAGTIRGNWPWLEEATVYIKRDELQRYQSLQRTNHLPSDERPWAIVRRQSFADWCRRTEVLNEADRRLAEEGDESSRRGRARVLVAMAEECGRKVAVETMTTTLQRLKREGSGGNDEGP